MRIEIREQPFLPVEELAAYQQIIEQNFPGQYGATAIFIGTMRDMNDGESVQSMSLEHYPGMTERQLQLIVNNAVNKWALFDALIIHRVGHIQPHDPIVLIAVWSAHRAEAFAACHFLIEELKSTVPFWKQELRNDAAHWVEHNTPGF